MQFVRQYLASNLGRRKIDYTETHLRSRGKHNTHSKARR